MSEIESGLKVTAKLCIMLNNIDWCRERLPLLMAGMEALKTPIIVTVGALKPEDYAVSVESEGLATSSGFALSSDNDDDDDEFPFLNRIHTFKTGISIMRGRFCEGLLGKNKNMRVRVQFAASSDDLEALDARAGVDRQPLLLGEFVTDTATLIGVHGKEPQWLATLPSRCNRLSLM